MTNLHVLQFRHLTNRATVTVSIAQSAHNRRGVILKANNMFDTELIKHIKTDALHKPDR